MSDQEDIAMDDQVDEPKKRRGAPKKAATKVKADVEASDEPPVKRGRGRPPGPGKKAAKTKPAPKPKKQADDEDANEEGEDEDADKAPSKRRGRPPKAAAKGAKAKAAKAKSESESEQEDEEDDISEHEEPAPPAKAKNGKAAAKTAPKNGHSDVDEEADQADEDEDADEGKPDAASSDARIKIVVEHCKSCHTYRRRADDIIDALKEKWSGIEVDYNPKAPRRGSFEINLINDNGEEVPLWSGLKKGPPRKLKFPDPEVVVEKMTKVYDSGKE